MKKTKQHKHKGGKPFTLRERSIIEVRWCRDNKTMTEIAKELGRSKSSVSREIGGRPRKGRRKYGADHAHRQALMRIQQRGNTSKMSDNSLLLTYVESHMRDEGWSPEQVSLRLLIDHRDDSTMRISHEAIYQHVYRQIHRGGNGVVKRGCVDLRPYLPRRHKRRVKKGFRKARKVEREASLPSIEKRPEAVAQRARIGDWEDDTLVSRSCAERVKSIVERKSGVALFGKTKDGTAESCDAIVQKRLGMLPKNIRLTLTRDRGTENVAYQSLQHELDLTCYFAHTYASYERGTNENTNGLLRRFFPKKTDWSAVSDEDIARAEHLINTRPRKRHGGLTPLEVLFRETGVAIYP